MEGHIDSDYGKMGMGVVRYLKNPIVGVVDKAFEGRAMKEFINISRDIKIYGNPKLKLDGNYTVKRFKKDHRVFMMSCIAALTLGGKWKIYDTDSINSSFPNFLDLIKKLGAVIK